jgi:hypothetical protein
VKVDRCFRCLDRGFEPPSFFWRFSISAVSWSMSLLIHSAWLGGSPHFLAAVLDEGFAMFGLFAFGEGHTR